MNRADATHLLGVWAIEPRYFSGMCEIAQVLLQSKTSSVEALTKAGTEPQLATVSDAPEGGKVAVIDIGGPITKHSHAFHDDFGGTSTTGIRRALDAALADPAVDAVILYIDSPGGTVAGTVDLAEDVARAAQLKPVVAYIEDLGASAAYWIGSQANAVLANKSARVGSIGVFTVVRDFSEALEGSGIKTHVISTGDYKGAFVPGSKVTEKQLSAVQAEVDDINEMFVAAVARGRGMAVEAVRKLADGRVHIGEQSVKLGLVDGITRFEAAVARAAELARKRKRDTYATADAAATPAAATTAAPATAAIGSDASVAADAAPAPLVAARESQPSYSPPVPERAEERLMPQSGASMPDSAPAPAPAPAPAAGAATPTLDPARIEAVEVALAALKAERDAANARSLAERRDRVAAEYGLDATKLTSLDHAGLDQLEAAAKSIRATSRANPLGRAPPVAPGTPESKALAEMEANRQAFLNDMATNFGKVR